MSIKVALPKGRLLKETAALLEKAEWGLDDYRAKARLYRLKSARFPGMLAKIFHEKDIPIQVAVGNYELGICGHDWVEELLSRYPSSDVVRLKNLGYGLGSLYAASGDGFSSLRDFSDSSQHIRIASEYPNLAESLAEKLRLKHFSVFPLWGSAEAYPPDSAELVILPRKSESELTARGLKPLAKLLDHRAYLIANRESLRSRNLAEVISSITGNLVEPEEAMPELAEIVAAAAPHMSFADMDENIVRLALPDGHQQPHVRRILDAAGIQMVDYPSETGNRRPQSNMEGVAIKVIRPQDMPLQVANGNFDIAITGRDWLTEHRHQFPTSPACELVDLKYGWVRIVAVVANEVPVEDAASLSDYCRSRPVRIATEYINIADNYARESRINDYRIIPTWGSTEAFLPEDADILIENTETGGTIARHNLKIVDTLLESTACLIGNRQSLHNTSKAVTIGRVSARLKKTVETLS